MRFSIDQQTAFAKKLLEDLKDQIGAELVEKILANPQSTDVEIDDQRANVKALREKLATIDSEEAKHLNELADYLIKKSVWIFQHRRSAVEGDPDGRFGQVCHCR